MPSENEKKPNAKTTLVAGMNLTAAQVKAMDGLSVIFGRLVLTLFSCILLVVTTVAVLWKPNAWSIGLESLMGISVARCFLFYFPSRRK